MLRQYKNKFVVVREAIQNSVDAGAKQIAITIKDKYLRIDDDGVGMNLEEIKRYWNTLGRTSKRREDGAIGEFGLGRLTLLLLSDEMHMETMKERKPYHVVTDRLGKIQIQSGNRKQRGTSVWINTHLPPEIRQQFIDYAETVAKARSEIIEFSGRKISQNRYGPTTEVAASMKINERGMRGCIWIPVEALGRGRTKKEREAVIKIYVARARARIRASADRNLAQAMSELDRLTDKLHIPKPIKENAAVIYRNALGKGLVRGRRISTTVAASLYVACRITQTTRTLSEIAIHSPIDKKDISRCYRILLRELNLRMPLPKAQLMVPKIASKVEVGEETQRKAIEILGEADRLKITGGRAPIAMAAAALYMACMINDEKLTQRDMATAAGVSEVTIRNRSKEFKRFIKN